eukprot:symbB.v1.2.027009.t2/scaffold2631.1/size74421/4
MGCTCSKAFKAPEPSRNPTLLENGRRSALPQSKPTETQRLESWELQLLRASSELKMKLKDPHFVAKRCDLDSSGDLDMHELKQATRAFGPNFSAKELLEFMAGAARINKERFAQIVTDAPLQQLESIFITSGWLSAKCNAFNLEYADAIREGKKFLQAANLYAMDTFVVTPMSQPGKCDARDQDGANVVPQANEKMSFSEVVNPCGLIVHCFVSHFWGHLFSQTVTALRRWAEMNRERMGTESPKSVVFWICLFALNQHAVADEVGENPMQGPFNAALARAEGGAVMVLDEEINPFKRIWCLFEISRLKELNQPFELICEMGSLSKPESLAVQQSDPAAVERLLQATCEALSKVSALNAKASVKEDQIRIWQEIADPGLRKMLRGNAGALRRGIIEPEGLESAFTEFNRFSQALLSTSLLEFYLVHKQHVAAAKCCEKGACFTQEQFADIITHGISEADRPTWLSNLLVINATDARLGIVRLLLQSRVCMEAVHCSLINAAAGGQEEVTKLLLDHRADAAATNRDGVSALMVAALCGHEEVAKLLLDHRADAAATNSDGVSALMAAAQGGHEAVAKLLLDQGADVLAAANNGATALMLAAHGGHEAVTKLLLDHGADVAAADNNGQTALMLAPVDGHEAVTKLLLDAGADVAAADEQWPKPIVLHVNRCFDNTLEKHDFGGCQRFASPGMGAKSSRGTGCNGHIITCHGGFDADSAHGYVFVVAISLAAKPTTSSSCNSGMLMIQHRASTEMTMSSRSEWLPQGDCPDGTFEIPQDYRRDASIWGCCSRCPEGQCYADCDECVDAEANGITTTIFTLPENHVVVDIGHTSRRAKCVPVYEELVCDEDAGNVEKRVNGHTAPDTFVIWFDKKRMEVCAERTDSPWGGWGMGLKIVCALANPTTTTTTTSTTSTSRWAAWPFRPVTEPRDQACRGRNHSDNSASFYKVVAVSGGIAECRQKCLAMERNKCKGIEYSGFARCELWTRSEGIGATNGVPGFSCEMNVQAPVFSTPYWIEGGHHRACRGDDRNDNKQRYYAVEFGVFTLRDCQERCMNLDGCKGYAGYARLAARPMACCSRFLDVFSRSLTRKCGNTACHCTSPDDELEEGLLSFTQHTDRVDFMAQERQVKKARSLLPLLFPIAVLGCRCTLPAAVAVACSALPLPVVVALPLRCRRVPVAVALPSRGRCIAIALPLRSRRRCLLVWFGLVAFGWFALVW